MAKHRQNATTSIHCLRPNSDPPTRPLRLDSPYRRTIGTQQVNPPALLDWIVEQPDAILALRTLSQRLLRAQSTIATGARRCLKPKLDDLSARR